MQMIPSAQTYKLCEKTTPLPTTTTSKPRRRIARNTFENVYLTSVLLFTASLIMTMTSGATVSILTNYTCPMHCMCKKAIEIKPRHEELLQWVPEDGLTVICKLDQSTASSTGWPQENETNHFDNQTTAIILDGSNLGHLFRIKSPTAKIFHKVLYLSFIDSKVEHLEFNGMAMFPSLRCLKINHNLLHSRGWTSSMVPTSDLRILDLSNNHIHRLNDTSFTGMEELRSLHLQYNYVVSIKPFTFEDLDNLEYLDLTGNALSVAGLQTASLFGLSSIRHLKMGENQIFETVPEIVGKGLYNTRLEKFDLHGLTRLERIEKAAFKDLYYLRELNLSQCGVSKLDVGWLDSVTHARLEMLDISQSRMRRIEVHSLAAIDPKTEDQLATLPSIKWVSLGDSKSLTTLDGDAFNFVPSLQYLFLQRCNISRVNVASNDPFNPNKMNLKTTLPQLKAIWIYGNPLRCNCHVRALLHASLPPPAPTCVTNPLQGVSNCDKDTSTDTSPPIQIDPPRYEWEKKKVTVIKSKIIPCCYHPEMGIRVEFSNARLDELVCQTDRITVFISIVLGPLAFAAAILVAFMCGFVRTLVRRVKLYHSGAYLVMDHKQSLLEMRRSQQAASGSSKDIASQHDKPTNDHTHLHHQHQPKKSKFNNLQFRHGTNVVMNKLKTTSLSVPQHSYEMTRLGDEERGYSDLSTRP